MLKTRKRSKGSIDRAFAARIRTENQDQASFCSFALREVSVHAELALGHLRYSLTDVPPQSNSPPGTVLGADRERTSAALNRAGPGSLILRRHGRELLPATTLGAFDPPFRYRAPSAARPGPPPQPLPRERDDRNGEDPTTYGRLPLLRRSPDFGSRETAPTGHRQELSHSLYSFRRPARRPGAFFVRAWR